MEKRKRGGQPKPEGAHFVETTIRIEPTQRAVLRALARERGRSISELIRDAIDRVYMGDGE